MASLFNEPGAAGAAPGVGAGGVPAGDLWPAAIADPDATMPFQVSPGGDFGTGGLRRTGAPWPLLLAAVILAVAGGSLAWFTGSGLVTIACWVAAGPLAMGLLALFIAKDAQARASGVYSRPAWVDALYWAGIGLSLAAVVGCALRIALWVGRI